MVPVLILANDPAIRQRQGHVRGAPRARNSEPGGQTWHGEPVRRPRRRLWKTPSREECLHSNYKLSARLGTSWGSYRCTVSRCSASLQSTRHVRRTLGEKA
jgi:hypothetical protein